MVEKEQKEKTSAHTYCIPEADAGVMYYKCNFVIQSQLPRKMQKQITST